MINEKKDRVPKIDKKLGAAKKGLKDITIYGILFPSPT